MARDPLDDVRRAEREARERAAREREARTPPILAGRHASARPAVRGAPLAFRDGRWCIGEDPLSVGDIVEVYTNRAAGWLRGRFEWDGEGRPRLGINVWDPHGEVDEDGLPPWVGDLDAVIPERAVVRRGR